MDKGQPGGVRVYRASGHLLVVVAAVAALFTLLAIFVAAKKADWTVVGVVVAATAVFLLLLRVLRLEIGPDGFSYRNLSGLREVAFAQVGHAEVEAIQASSAPQGVAVFRVVRRDGGRVTINLRTFPIEAAAHLFTALESHGIRIAVANAWASRRMAEQVRDAQARLRG